MSKPLKNLRLPKLSSLAAQYFDLKESQTSAGVWVGTWLQEADTYEANTFLGLAKLGGLTLVACKFYPQWAHLFFFVWARKGFFFCPIKTCSCCLPCSNTSESCLWCDGERQCKRTGEETFVPVVCQLLIKNNKEEMFSITSAIFLRKELRLSDISAGFFKWFSIGIIVLFKIQVGQQQFLSLKTPVCDLSHKLC